jgi:predicted HicB family RNase H-like nuclease
VKHRRATTRRAALVLAVVAGFGLSACEPNQLGAAAIVGEQRITVTEVQSYLDTVREQRAQYDLPADLGPDAARLEVERRVLDLVFEQAAREMGIVITEADIEETRAADQRSPDELAELAAQNNLTQETLDQLYRRFTIERRISEEVQKQFPGADEARLNEEFAKRLVATAQAMKIRINPRYGRFDPQQGQIQPTQYDFLQPPAQ